MFVRSQCPPVRSVRPFAVSVRSQCPSVRSVRPFAILAQVASAAWAKVRARVRSAGDGVRTGLGQPATFSRGGAPLRPQIR